MQRHCNQRVIKKNICICDPPAARTLLLPYRDGTARIACIQACIRCFKTACFAFALFVVDFSFVLVWLAAWVGLFVVLASVLHTLGVLP